MEALDRFIGRRVSVRHVDGTYSRGRILKFNETGVVGSHQTSDDVRPVFGETAEVRYDDGSWAEVPTRNIEFVEEDYPRIERQSFTTKHPCIWRVFVRGYERGSRFEVYGSIDEQKARKALAALRRHGIASRREYRDSPVYKEFIRNGANLA